MPHLFILLSFWEGLAGLIVSVVVISTLMALISKLFNMNIVSRTGQTLATPKSFDNIVNTTKIGLEQSYHKIKSLSFKSYNDLKNQNASKLERLTILAKLKSEGILTEEEFQNLKAEIMK